MAGAMTPAEVKAECNRLETSPSSHAAGSSGKPDLRSSGKKSGGKKK